MKPKLQDPPPIRIIARGLSGAMKSGVELAEKNPGKWVRCAEYGTEGSARSTSLRFRERGYETTTRGRVVYLRKPIESEGVQR